MKKIILIFLILSVFLFAEGIKKQQSLWVLDRFTYNNPTYGDMRISTYVDPQTGVNYIIVEDGSNGISVAITPRLTKEGKLYITERK